MRRRVLHRDCVFRHQDGETARRIGGRYRVCGRRSGGLGARRGQCSVGAIGQHQQERIKRLEQCCFAPAAERDVIGLCDEAVGEGARAGLVAVKIAFWSATLNAFAEPSVTAVLDLGPGHALAEMMQASQPSMPCYVIDGFHSVNCLRSWIASE